MEKNLRKAFIQFFPETKIGEIKIVEGIHSNGAAMAYVQSKENRMKVFDDRVEMWERIDTKKPVKTLELKKETIQALSQI